MPSFPTAPPGIFALAVLGALITFGARYFESFIYGWNA